MLSRSNEAKCRSILKALTTKAGEIAISATILQLIFSQPLISVGLPTLLEVLQMGWYFIHERIWSHIQWGKCEGCHYLDFHEKRKNGGLPHD